MSAPNAGESMPRNEKPIDMARGPVAKFAAELRELRRGARLTYRAMADRANYSVTVLSQAAAGTAVPQWSVVRAYVAVCRGDVPDWQRRWQEMRRDQELFDAAAAQPHRGETGGVETFQAARSLQKNTAEEPVEANRDSEIKLFLLDDHELIRHGVRALVEDQDDITVVGEAATVAEALARIPRAHPDVALLDIRLPDGSGIDVCREIRSTMVPPPACLMFTSYSDDDALFGAIMAGAAGYMLKQVSGRSLIDAIRTVAGGGSLLDATLTASVMNKLRGESGVTPESRYEQLSVQERRVLDLVAEGLTNGQIAERLFLSEKTVKNYVSSVLHKLGVERRTSAAVYVQQFRQHQ